MNIDEILYLRAAGVSAEEIKNYTAQTPAPAPEAPGAPAPAPRAPAPEAPGAPEAVSEYPKSPALDTASLADAIVAALQARNIGTSNTPAPAETAEEVLAHILNPNA